MAEAQIAGIEARRAERIGGCVACMINPMAFTIERTVLEEQLSSTRAELLSGLKDEEMTALRAYVTAFFPRVPSDFVWPEDVVEFSVATQVWEEVVRFSDRIAAHRRDLLVDLDLITQPSAAFVAVQPAGGGPARARLSNDRIPNLYRGIYAFRVTLDGHKASTGILNLIDDPGTVLSCKLVPAGNTHSSKCALRTKP
jgi:hypothetical protein